MKKFLLITVSTLLITLLTSASFLELRADSICLRGTIKAKKVTLKKKQVTTAKCPSGFLKIIDTATLTGPAGADGSLRIYGTSSASSVTYSQNATLQAGSMEFYDFTVQSGVTLTVPSGTVIRCYGTFTNAGTINVEYGVPGGFMASDAAPVNGFERPPHPGVSSSPAGWGECFNSGGEPAHGGKGGTGLSEAAAAMLRYPGANAGGGSGLHGSGGGSLVVLAKGGIVNSGTINANGESSFAGGAGGVVILASPASVSNSGTINATGGSGANAESANILGAGGGGGGGILHLISPTIQAGTYSVAGGAGGAEDSAAPGVFHCGGAGGGASGGNGGDGGDTIAKSWAAAAGSTGRFISTQSDPTSLF